MAFPVNHRTRCEHMYRGLLAALAVPPKDAQTSKAYIHVLDETQACDDVWDLSDPRSALFGYEDSCAQKPRGLGRTAETDARCAHQALRAHRWNIRLGLFRALPWRARVEYMMDTHPFMLLGSSVLVALGLRAGAGALGRAGQFLKSVREDC